MLAGMTVEHCKDEVVVSGPKKKAIAKQDSRFGLRSAFKNLTTGFRRNDRFTIGTQDGADELQLESVFRPLQVFDFNASPIPDFISLIKTQLGSADFYSPGDLLLVVG